jgi:hypothetical protein
VAQLLVELLQTCRAVHLATPLDLVVVLLVFTVLGMVLRHPHQAEAQALEAQVLARKAAVLLVVRWVPRHLALLIPAF